MCCVGVETELHNETKYIVAKKYKQGTGSNTLDYKTPIAP
jgi:hypothetical protein